MATLTIRNIPEEVVEQLKGVATGKGCSMEHEVRELLVNRYAPRAEVLSRVRARWSDELAPTRDEIEAWRNAERR